LAPPAAGGGETLSELPALAPLRVQPAFERHDKHGKAAAEALAQRLDGQGVATSAPVMARRGLGPGIHYFYVEDRASVAELARRLGSAFEPVTLATGKAAEGQLPGAVIVVVQLLTAEQEHDDDKTGYFRGDHGRLSGLRGRGVCPDRGS
jgi:hypothetical protein